MVIPFDGMMYCAPCLRYVYVSSLYIQPIAELQRQSTKCKSPSKLTPDLVAYVTARFPTMGGTPDSKVPMSAPLGHPLGPAGQDAYSARSRVQFVTALKPLFGRWPDPSNSIP